MTMQILSPGSIEELRTNYPSLPESYFLYLQNVGWGETCTGCMIYSGPVAAREVYGEVPHLTTVVLLGDDFQGYCLAFDISKNCWLEIDPVGNRSELDERSAFAAYLDSRFSR